VIKLASAANEAGQTVVIKGLGEFTCQIPKTTNMKTDFITERVAEVDLKEGETYSISLHAVPDGWKSAHVHSMEVVPAR
jgi:hypothetical protein